MGTFGGIGPQGIGKWWTDRNVAGLVELAIAYGQQRILQVDIVEGQALCLTEPQPRAVEKQEQRPQGVAVELERALPVISMAPKRRCNSSSE